MEGFVIKGGTPLFWQCAREYSEKCGAADHGGGMHDAGAGGDSRLSAYCRRIQHA